MGWLVMGAGESGIDDGARCSDGDRIESQQSRDATGSLVSLCLWRKSCEVRVEEKEPIIGGSCPCPRVEGPGSWVDDGFLVLIDDSERYLKELATVPTPARERCHTDSMRVLL